MVVLLLFVCAVLACQTQAQYLPRLPPLGCIPTPQPCVPPPQPCVPAPPVCLPSPQPCALPPQPCVQLPQPCVPAPKVCASPQPCTNSPQVVTTIIDNSVSNSLANALQLLIVSNLIENTMKSPCESIYSPTIDCLAPQIDYLTPYVPCDPIITSVAPCPCDPIEIIPNVCYPEVLPISNVGCGCGCDGPYGVASILPNYGCDCGPRYGPSCGCDSQRYLPNIGCDVCGPKFGIQNYGLPNIGCGCDSPRFGIQNIGYELLANALGSRCGCDGLFNSPCGCGIPNLPIGINVEPLSILDPCSCSCPNKCGIYY